MKIKSNIIFREFTKCSLRFEYSVHKYHNFREFPIVLF